MKNRLALIFFFASIAFFIFGFGFVVGKKEFFPYSIIERAIIGYGELKNEMLRLGLEDLSSQSNEKLPWYYSRVDEPNPTPVRNTGRAYTGLNLVTGIGDNLELFAKIVDMDGREVHSWNVDWFRIWPDADHLPEKWIPKSKPGATVHGVVILDNGDLVFNFDKLGLVRLDRDSNVVWRLPYQTHHSVELDEKGSLWVCGMKYHVEGDDRFPNRVPPFFEQTLLEVSPEGRIIEEWSVDEILRENGYEGLLYLGSLENVSTRVDGDTLHLNDVEPFPEKMTAGLFDKGDLLVSLRNINTVFVFNRYTRKIKFISSGWFVRQHDPDFIDGNSFSVFDNNNIAPEEYGQQSRIVIVSAPEGTKRVFFEGSPENHFYTDHYGKNQWLLNGDLLITESRTGRAFEINRGGEVVWEYVNYVDEGIVGLLDQVQRIPLEQAQFYNNG
ncbi:MAG: arylsulfotransferase family protein [Thermoleophilia bacterium]